MPLFKRKTKDTPALEPALLAQAQADATCATTVLLQASDLMPVYFSASFENFFGVSKQQFEDDPEVLFSLLSASEARRVKRLIESWDYASPLSFSVSYSEEQQNGAVRHLRCRLTPASGGEHILFEAIDVSPEAELVAAAEARADSMAHESRSTMDFLNNMSHEIRTPLNGIIGSLALIQKHLGNRDQALSDLARAEELSELLLQLINDVLDMSRIESGKVELEYAPVLLDELAASIRAMFEGTATSKGLNFSVELQDCQDRVILADELRLTQVIVNFISNSMKFTDPGGEVRVTLKEMYRAQNSMHLMIRVHDTGCGMSPEFVKRVFRPFEQESATTTRKHGGSGLGMAIADNLVRLMGGKIVVQSQVGVGTDFITYISFAVPEASEYDLAALEAAADAAGAQGGDQDETPLAGLKILMAEDNDLNAEIATDIIEGMGATITRAHDGQEAIELFEGGDAGAFDAILMDIQMPKVDGWKATEAIRAHERADAKTIPIFALSANAFVEDKRRSEEAGMNGHISKPIDFDELCTQLRTALNIGADGRKQ